LLIILKKPEEKNDQEKAKKNPRKVDKNTPLKLAYVFLPHKYEQELNSSETSCDNIKRALAMVLWYHPRLISGRLPV
jgi:hypothetical protein